MDGYTLAYSSVVAMRKAKPKAAKHLLLDVSVIAAPLSNRFPTVATLLL